MSSDVEDTSEVIETAPAATHSKRTGISGHAKERIVAKKVRALCEGRRMSRNNCVSAESIGSWEGD